jgi:hypothetical protein
MNITMQFKGIWTRDRVLISIAWSVIAFCGLSAIAEARPGDVGRLLNFGSSGRDIALGGAVSALPQGANSLYWNPSLLSDVSQKDVGFLQAQLFSQTSMNWVGYAHPFKQRSGTLAGQLLQLKTESGERRDQFNEVNGSFNNSEQVMGFGYGFHPVRNGKLSFGLGFNALHRTLADASNTLYGFTVGGNYVVSQKLRTALVLQNVLRGKQGDTDDELPMVFKVGNAYQLVNGLFLTNDIEMSGFKSASFNFGAEFTWKMLCLRAGRPSDGDFAFGVGLGWKDARMDIAMSSHKDLGTSQILSLGMKFGKDRNLTRQALAEQYLQQGMKKYWKGDWLGAQALLRSALETQPSNAVIYLRENKVSGVISVLQLPSSKWGAAESQSEFLGSGDSARLIKEGVAAYIEGNDSTAVLMLQQALAYRKTDKRLEALIAKIQGGGKVQSGIELAPGLSPEEIVTLKMRKVEDYFDMNRYDDALKVCLEVVQLVPEMALPRVRLGSIYYAMANVDKARVEYEKALQLNPGDESLRRFMQMQGWLTGGQR